jgi:hypothetical protein
MPRFWLTDLDWGARDVKPAVRFCHLAMMVTEFTATLILLEYSLVSSQVPIRT